MKAVLLDTHVLHWLASDPARLSDAAAAAIAGADEVAVAAPTWFELAWLFTRGRIAATIPLRTWLGELSRGVRTLPLTPGVAARAAELPDGFPRDPADRIIVATAIEHGLPLLTADRRVRASEAAATFAVW